jgi:5'-nucleotidase (lipoprotein e(P4) family)
MKRNYAITLLLILISITATYFVKNQTTAQQPIADNEYQVSGTLYMQHAAEYRALCYQAFNWAKETLDRDEKNKKKLPKVERKKPRAIVVDIDETVLDNSPAQAYGIKNRKSFNDQDWTDWVNMKKAKAIPGGVEFLNYANSKGVKIFYVSNRDDGVHTQGTIENLKSVGYPDVSKDTLLLRVNKVSSKDERRKYIEKTHRIVILMGDNLNDMATQFEKKSIADRFAETDKVKNDWGTKYIALPNVMYGDWEAAIYEYKRLNEEEKSAKRNSALQLP